MKQQSLKILKSRSGQALVEFTFISITLLFCILGVMQFVLVLNASNTVHYAAYNAVRAGIVHGGDKEKMLEAARLSLIATFPSHGRADHLKGYYENYLSAKASDQDTSLTISGKPITRVDILNKKNLNCDQVVTFDDPIDTPNTLLSVRVVHQYELVIPLVNRMLYYLYTKFSAKEDLSKETVDSIAAKTSILEKTGEYKNIEYRIPLSGFYSMKLQSDYVHQCP